MTAGLEKFTVVILTNDKVYRVHPDDNVRESALFGKI